MEPNHGAGCGAVSQHLHIPSEDLADYYEAGWVLYGPSDTPGFVTVAWERLRAAVVPFACVADVMIRRDIERLQIREAAFEQLRPSKLIQASQIELSLLSLVSIRALLIVPVIQVLHMRRLNGLSRTANRIRSAAWSSFGLKVKK